MKMLRISPSLLVWWLVVCCTMSGFMAGPVNFHALPRFGADQEHVVDGQVFVEPLGINMPIVPLLTAHEYSVHTVEDKVFVEPLWINMPIVPPLPAHESPQPTVEDKLSVEPLGINMPIVPPLPAHESPQPTVEDKVSVEPLGINMPIVPHLPAHESPRLTVEDKVFVEPLGLNMPIMPPLPAHESPQPTVEDKTYAPSSAQNMALDQPSSAADPTSSPGHSPHVSAQEASEMTNTNGATTPRLDALRKNRAAMFPDNYVKRATSTSHTTPEENLNETHRLDSWENKKDTELVAEVSENISTAVPTPATDDRHFDSVDKNKDLVEEEKIVSTHNEPTVRDSTQNIPMVDGPVQAAESIVPDPPHTASMVDRQTQTESTTADVDPSFPSPPANNGDMFHQTENQSALSESAVHETQNAENSQNLGNKDAINSRLYLQQSAHESQPHQTSNDVKYVEQDSLALLPTANNVPHNARLILNGQPFPFPTLNAVTSCGPDRNGLLQCKMYVNNHLVSGNVIDVVVDRGQPVNAQEFFTLAHSEHTAGVAQLPLQTVNGASFHGSTDTLSQTSEPTQDGTIERQPTIDGGHMNPSIILAGGPANQPLTLDERHTMNKAMNLDGGPTNQPLTLDEGHITNQTINLDGVPTNEPLTLDAGHTMNQAMNLDGGPMNQPLTLDAGHTMNQAMNLDGGPTNQPLTLDAGHTMNQAMNLDGGPTNQPLTLDAGQTMNQAMNLGERPTNQSPTLDAGHTMNQAMNLEGGPTNQPLTLDAGNTMNQAMNLDGRLTNQPLTLDGRHPNQPLTMTLDGGQTNQQPTFDGGHMNQELTLDGGQTNQQPTFDGGHMNQEQTLDGGHVNQEQTLDGGHMNQEQTLDGGQAKRHPTAAGVANYAPVSGDRPLHEPASPTVEGAPLFQGKGINIFSPNQGSGLNARLKGGVRRWFMSTEHIRSREEL